MNHFDFRLGGLVVLSLCVVGCFDFDKQENTCWNAEDREQCLSDTPGGGGENQGGAGGTGGGPAPSGGSGGGSGGTSEPAGPPVLYFNEIYLRSSQAFIEIYNAGTGPANLRSYRMTTGVSRLDEENWCSAPEGYLEPGGFLVFSTVPGLCGDTPLPYHCVDDCSFALHTGQNMSTLYLYEGDELVDERRLSGSGLILESWQALPDGADYWSWAPPTRGEPNKPYPF